MSVVGRTVENVEEKPPALSPAVLVATAYRRIENEQRRE